MKVTNVLFKPCCDESREWYEWEARWRYDMDEIHWQEHESRRMARDNELCGYTPDPSGAGENQGKEDKLSSDKPDGVD